MKKCPFCAEEIQDEAVKCKHCGEYLDKKEKLPWYFTTATLIIAILSIGPFALPLVCFHPRYSLLKKTIISAVVLILSYYLYQAFSTSMKTMNDYYQMLLNNQPR